MQKYVVGFLFDERQQYVLLIKKLKPEWQSGCLNGIGGKIEQQDGTIEGAMVREFKEETGIEFHNWNLFCELTHITQDWRYISIVVLVGQYEVTK